MARENYTYRQASNEIKCAAGRENELKIVLERLEDYSPALLGTYD